MLADFSTLWRKYHHICENITVINYSHYSVTAKETLKKMPVLQGNLKILKTIKAVKKKNYCQENPYITGDS